LTVMLNTQPRSCTPLSNSVRARSSRFESKWQGAALEVRLEVLGTIRLAGRYEANDMLRVCR